MTDTKPTLDEQIACMVAMRESHTAVGSAILTSLEELKRIQSAEMPVEPPIFSVALTCTDGKERMIENCPAVLKTDYDALKAVIQRKDAEAREQRERAERAVSDKQVIEAQWATAHNRAESAERERDALRKDAALGASLERAARDLPGDWMVIIELENGAATVRLVNPDGDSTHIDIDADNRIVAEINAAIDNAIDRATTP
jgi:hypothetical protein